MCNNSSKRSVTDHQPKPHGEIVYDYFQSLIQIMEKVSTGLEEVGRVSSSLPRIPFEELSSKYDATMLILILAIEKLEIDVHEAEEAVENLPWEDIVGLLEVAGTPHIEAKCETRHDVMFLKSRLRKLEWVVEAMKGLVKIWVERRVVTDQDNAAVEVVDSQ
jgi:hypothetical protein